jgi:hypothetical protein
MLNRRHDLAPGGSIGAQLVGDHPPRRIALLLQQTLQQAFRRFGIAPRLDDFVEDVAILIHGPPESVLLAGNGDHNLVELPDVATARLLAFEAAGESRPELQRPSPDRFIGDENAALEQHLLNQPQAQWEPEVEPYRVSDDLGWKAMAFVANGLDHAGSSTRLAFILGLM